MELKESVMIHRINLTTEKNGVHSITDEVEAIVEASGVNEGICVITIPHTTAGITVTSKWDETGFQDIKSEMRRIVPTRIDFAHQFDTPEDAAGHIKSILIGPSLVLMVSGGKLDLGSSQGIFFLEFDGPRERRYSVKVIEC